MRKDGLSRLNTYLWFLVFFVIGMIAINEYFRSTGDIGVTRILIQNKSAAANGTVAAGSIKVNYTCYNCYALSSLEDDISGALGRTVIFDGTSSRVGFENREYSVNENVLVASFFYEPYREKKDRPVVMLTNVTDESKLVMEGELEEHVLDESVMFRSKLDDDEIMFEDFIKTSGIVEHLPTGAERSRWQGYKYLNHTFDKKTAFDSVEAVSDDVVELLLVTYGDYDIEFMKQNPSLEELKYYAEKRIRHLGFTHAFAVRCNPAFVIYLFGDSFDSRGVLTDDNMESHVDANRARLTEDAHALLQSCRENYPGVVTTRTVRP